MKHLKLYEELTDFTKDLFGLKTKLIFVQIEISKLDYVKKRLQEIFITNNIPVIGMEEEKISYQYGKKEDVETYWNLTVSIDEPITFENLKKINNTSFKKYYGGQRPIEEARCCLYINDASDFTKGRAVIITDDNIFIGDQDL